MKKAQELTEQGSSQRRHSWDDIKLTSQELCVLRVIPAWNHDEQIYETNLSTLFAQGHTLVQHLSPSDQSHSKV